MPDLNWTLTASVSSSVSSQFSDRADLSFSFELKIPVPAMGMVEYVFPSGWTKGIMLFVMDPGEPDGDLLWGFDSQELIPADAVNVSAGMVACQALLAARKRIRFQNKAASQKLVVLYAGHLKEELRTPTNVEEAAYVVPGIRVEVQPVPEFVFYPEIAYHLRSVGAVNTTLPKNGCLTVPIQLWSEGAPFAAFTFSFSKYTEGLFYSIDAGKTWTPITQASVSFGIDACAHIPKDLSAVQFENRGTEDVGISFVVAQFIPPFLKSNG